LRVGLGFLIRGDLGGRVVREMAFKVLKCVCDYGFHDRIVVVRDTPVEKTANTWDVLCVEETGRWDLVDLVGMKMTERTGKGGFLKG
jgi:hypothetical protein